MARGILYSDTPTEEVFLLNMFAKTFKYFGFLSQGVGLGSVLTQ